MEPLSNELPILSQTEAARAMGVKNGTLSKWKREGWLMPSLSDVPGITREGRLLRAYTFNDVVAGRFRLTSSEYFAGADLNEMVACVQRAEPEELEHAEFVTVRTSQQMMRIIWVSDMRRELNGEELGEGTHPSGYAWVETLGERLKDRAQLSEIVTAISAVVSQEVFQEGELAKLTRES